MSCFSGKHNNPGNIEPELDADVSDDSMIDDVRKRSFGDVEFAVVDKLLEDDSKNDWKLDNYCMILV